MKLGVQMYTLRNLMRNEAESIDMLSFVKAEGAEVVEIVLDNIDGKRIASHCKNIGLEIGSTHCPPNKVISDTIDLADQHSSMGVQIMGVGGMPYINPKKLDLDKIKLFWDMFNQSAKKAASYGITLEYHNHAWEFEKIEKNKTILDYLMQNSADNIQFCLDIYWAKFAKISAEEYLTKYRNKINILHFKDYKKCFFAPRIMTVGHGNLDIQTIYDLAEANQVKYGYIEDDTACNPKKSVSEGLKYLNIVRDKNISQKIKD